MSNTISNNLADAKITQMRTKKGGKIVDDGTKNLKGMLGPICNNCAGLGFTGSLNGGRLKCSDCQSTGVTPVDSRYLQSQINDLHEEIQGIKELIVKFAKEKLS